jgi:hypothetical protein
LENMVSGVIRSGVAMIWRGTLEAAAIVRPFPGMDSSFTPAGDTGGGGRWKNGYRFGWRYQLESFELGRRHDSSGDSIPNGDGGELWLVFAFIVGSSGHAGRAGGGCICAGSFSEPSGEVFGFLGGR